jgi:ribosomal protein L44E
MNVSPPARRAPVQAVQLELQCSECEAVRFVLTVGGYRCAECGQLAKAGSTYAVPASTLRRKQE